MIKSLYVHIPFCIKKCLYCDFNSYTNSNLQDDYIKALEKELLSIVQKNYETIFIGGGTPTILSVENFEKLLSILKEFGAKEYTVECNPGTLDRAKLELMKTYGVNRLSIGLQAWQDKHLATLGRIHSQQEFIQNYRLAREIGFENINIDLMFGIPNQTIEEWKETIDNVLRLCPEHLSCYGLIVEEGTPFHELYEKGVYRQADEELEREMYYQAIRTLEKHGMRQYEISNFALPGYECRHNITYWKNEEYIGVGAGAHSYADRTRYANVMGVQDYIMKMDMGDQAWVSERIPVSKQDEISEYMFLGLRMMEGINKEHFKSRFGSEIADIYNVEILELKEMKLIEETDSHISLTSLGVDLSNQVFVKFLK